MIIPVIYLLGAIHGLFLALVLIQKKVNRLPNILLGLLMIVFSIDLGMAGFQSLGLHQQYPNFIGIDYPVTLLYGPLLLLYVKSMRDGLSKLKFIDYLHFLPFLILLIYMVPFYMGPSTYKLALLSGATNVPNTNGFGIINDLKVLHGLLYVVGVISMLVSYRKKIKNSYSTIDKINLNWLQRLIIGAALLGGISGGLHFIPVSNETVLMGLSSSIYDDITLLAVTFFVYAIGYMGLHQPEVFTQSQKHDSKGSSEESNSQKYEKSGLDQASGKQYADKLLKIMEEQKLYQNSELKLGDLAAELDISTHNLTEIINRYVGKNFYDFVNEYRVEDVKKQLVDPKSESKTMLAIALDAGFSSKSTFNAVFKKQTGMTPSQFRDQHNLIN